MIFWVVCLGHVLTVLIKKGQDIIKTQRQYEPFWWTKWPARQSCQLDISLMSPYSSEKRQLWAVLSSSWAVNWFSARISTGSGSFSQISVQSQTSGNTKHDRCAANKSRVPRPQIRYMEPAYGLPKTSTIDVLPNSWVNPKTRIRRTDTAIQIPETWWHQSIMIPQ